MILIYVLAETMAPSSALPIGAARVVSEMCRSADQREILRNAFELLEAFDEIVSLGYREPLNLMQGRNVLEMESHEEKIQEIIARVRTFPSTSFMCGI